MSLRITAIVLLLALQMSSASAQSVFSDTAFSWYAPRIGELKESGAITGYSDGTFKPRDPINRAEFLTLLMRSRSQHEPAGGLPCFDDLESGAWYVPWICTAVNRGIVQGYPDGTFKPEQTVNAAEAVKMVVGIFREDIDDGRGDEWYEPYVQHLDDQEILQRNSYLPWDLLTRERAADLIYRIKKQYDDHQSPRRSAGCDKPAPQNPPASVRVNGEDRPFLLTVPDGYRSDKALPLLVAFHGRTNANEEVRRYYRFDRIATDYFIVYPSGKSNDNGLFSWSDAGDTPYKLRDLALFDAIVHTMANTYCIDLDTIFVAGHSLGGWFANSIACVRGGIVRASASVGSSSVLTDCAGPAAGMLIHNPDDLLAPINSGIAARDLRLETNACEGPATPTEPASLNCERASCFYEENPLIWCPHTNDNDHNGTYYPHNWPRDAGEVIIDFFEEMRAST